MNIRQLVKRSALTPLAAFPARARTVTSYECHQARRSLAWLAGSREHTNFTYELTTENVVGMAWFEAAVTGLGFDKSFRCSEELHDNQALPDHLRRAVAASPLRRVMDPVPRYGRRAASYAIVRATRPQHVVETGVDKELGSCVFAPALLRNAHEGRHGRLTAPDVNQDAGALIAEGPLVMTDDGRLALSDFVESSGRRCLMFREDPGDHWAHGSVLDLAMHVAT